MTVHSTFIRAARCRVRLSSRVSQSNIRHSSRASTGSRILPLACPGLAPQQSPKKQSCTRSISAECVGGTCALLGYPPVRMPRRVETLGRIWGSSASKSTLSESERARSFVPILGQLEVLDSWFEDCCSLSARHLERRNPTPDVRFTTFPIGVPYARHHSNSPSSFGFAIPSVLACRV